MDFFVLLNKAHEAGMAAGEAAVPRAMTVSGGGRDYYVPEGPCGFAWIHVPNAKGPLVRFLKNASIGHKNYRKGWDIWVSAFGQSMDRKVAYAAAYAKVLNEAGFDAYADSRMD